MCRLFGLYANMPVNVVFSFFETPVSSLEELSYDNPSGWGVAWLDDRGWHIYKEPTPLYSSRNARRVIEKLVKGKIVVSHVRLASVGNARIENTHPWLYRGWVFAHNGTVYDREKLLQLLRDGYRDLEGDTDSEALFHLLVQEVEEVGDPVEAVKIMVDKLVSNGVGFSSLNFIASDGVRLYALRYAVTGLDYYTLYYVRRPVEDLELKGISKTTRQLIRMKLTRGEKAVLVASEPMSDEPYWNPVPNRYLLVIHPGLRTELVKIAD